MLKVLCKHLMGNRLNPKVWSDIITKKDFNLTVKKKMADTTFTKVMRLT
jgi:hypothetical protein